MENRNGFSTLCLHFFRFFCFLNYSTVDEPISTHILETFRSPPSDPPPQMQTQVSPVSVIPFSRWCWSTQRRPSAWRTSWTCCCWRGSQWCWWAMPGWARPSWCQTGCPGWRKTTCWPKCPSATTPPPPCCSVGGRPPPTHTCHVLVLLVYFPIIPDLSSPFSVSAACCHGSSALAGD